VVDGAQLLIALPGKINFPIPEIAPLGRTLRAWRAQILAYFDTHGARTGDGPKGPPATSMSVTIGVAMVPGQTALIRTPRGAYSRAALRVRPRTPCLVAW
jgi:hypothetical protein